MAAMLTYEQVTENVEAVAQAWAEQRPERQRRRHLDPADFERLRDAGFLLASLPLDEGGLWESHARSTRRICDLLRVLAHGDSSVALVAAMHPSVLANGFWLGRHQVPAAWAEAWSAQCRAVFETVRDGCWWGTIASEPGSGGDLNLTQTVARPDPEAANPLRHRLTGQKHFGSGSGITSFMLTTAIPEGETQPETFFVDLRGVLDQRGAPNPGQIGISLAAAWDGHGMTATQSHALTFDGMPATRLAWPSHARRGATLEASGSGAFASVIVGIVEVAVETARRHLQVKRGSLRAFEQAEWARVEVEAWLVQQAYEGILHANEVGQAGGPAGLLGKVAIAELAESILARISRITGGGAYSRHGPFGFWLEDVRALGFLRPPWSLAVDRIVATSLPASAPR